ncbi:MAG: hypothetical protein A2Y34_00090 [Spirochaetes bacterium GWC1_27_15]|nr:MAG: hypothetical protein A2Z98_09870 [Spirochaetes bacterium GWB1_27_13]OHD25355.1 MAG: hypothetical protein A2Y34_00090 [Spirochaetes bacterium GWC1_27_15]
MIFFRLYLFFIAFVFISCNSISKDNVKKVDDNIIQTKDVNDSIIKRKVTINDEDILKDDYYDKIDEIILDVPFIPQFPPGTSWQKTKNCSQTAYLMVSCYYSNILPTVEGIKKIDDWLYQNLKLSIDNYNGSPLNIFQMHYLALNYEKYYNSEIIYDFDEKLIKRELIFGNLIIVSVFYPSPSDPKTKIHHAMVIVGINKEFIYVNDPGRTKGKSYKYKIEEFKEFVDEIPYCLLVVKRD